MNFIGDCLLRAFRHPLPVAIALLLLLTVSARASIGIDLAYGSAGQSHGYAAGDTLALYPDGRGLAVNIQGTTLRLLRVTADGRPDATFGNSGELSLPLTVAAGTLRLDALAIAPDGSALLALRTAPWSAGSVDYSLLRLRSDGSPDAAFGIGGIRTLQRTAECCNVVHDLAVQPDGRIVLAGSRFDDYYACAITLQVRRLLPDGSDDATFGQTGVATLARPDCIESQEARITLLPNGRIALTQRALAEEWSTILLQSDGSVATQLLDPQVGSAMDLRGISLAVTPAGTIYICGGKASGLLLGRLRADLTLDPAFGLKSLPFPYPTYQPLLAVATDGSLYVTVNGFIRVRPQSFLSTTVHIGTDGVVDTAFGWGGKAWLLGFVPEVRASSSGALLVNAFDDGHAHFFTRLSTTGITTEFVPAADPNASATIVAPTTTPAAATPVAASGSAATPASGGGGAFDIVAVLALLVVAWAQLARPRRA